MKVEIEANFFNEGFIMYQANLGPMAILDQILHGPENNSEIESQNLQAKKRPTINIGVFKNCPVYKHYMYIYFHSQSSCVTDNVNKHKYVHRMVKIIWQKSMGTLSILIFF